MQVKRHCMCRTDRRLHLTGQCRQDMIRRQGRRDDQIQFFRLYTRLFQRLLCRLHGHPGSGFLHRQMSRTDTGAAADPLIRGIHDLA